MIGAWFDPRWIGRLACELGLHAADYRTELFRDVLYTSTKCRRPGCEHESLVDMERIPVVLCTCRRYGFPSPTCNVHAPGKAVAA